VRTLIGTTRGEPAILVRTDIHSELLQRQHVQGVQDTLVFGQGWVTTQPPGSNKGRGPRRGNFA